MIKSFIRFLFRSISPYIPDYFYILLQYKRMLGVWPNLKTPKIFSEKLQWLKLHDRRNEYTQMVDKIAAKDYVAGKIGGEYIIPTLGVWDKAEDIDFESLPDKFVLKCNHNSGGLVVCTDKSKLDVETARDKLNHSLKLNYYYSNREYPYKNVPPRILAEQYMQDNSSKELMDYKFYCFNGRVEYCQVIADRSTCETIDFYDRNWVHQPFIGLYAKALHAKALHAKALHACPSGYPKMIEIAETLAAGIPFVRIDLYYINGHIYFGEITFFPLAGMGVFSPEEWNERLGEMIKLPSGK